MPTTVMPPLMCPKIGLTPEEGSKIQATAAFLRSRRHRAPEKTPGNANVFAMAYELNQDERNAIAAGALIYVGQVTYGNPPPEVLVHIGTDVAAEYYQVTEASPELLEKSRKDALLDLNKAWDNYQRTVAASLELEEDLQTENDKDRVVRLQSEALHGLDTALRNIGAANQAAGFGA